MNASEQTIFPSLGFEGRTALRVDEVAARLNVSRNHVIHLIEDGTLRAIDVRGRMRAEGGKNKTPRSCLRIPVEEYERLIRSRTG